MSLHDLDGTRRDYQEWRSTVSQTQRHGADSADVELDEEFDRLLDQSSLGTPLAQACQALTPNEVYDRLRSHLEASDDRGDCAADGTGPDTDDVVLGVVRSAAGDELPHLPQARDGSEAEWTTVYSAMLPIFTHWLQQYPARDCRVIVAQGVVHELLIQGVFTDVRPDVARSVVEIGFANTGALDLVVLNACSASVSSTHIADDLVNDLFEERANLFFAKGTASVPSRFFPLSFEDRGTPMDFRNLLMELAKMASYRKSIARGPLGTPRTALTSAAGGTSGTARPAVAQLMSGSCQLQSRHPRRGPRQRREPAGLTRPKPKGAPRSALEPRTRSQLESSEQTCLSWLRFVRSACFQAISVGVLMVGTVVTLLSQLT